MDDVEWFTSNRLGSNVLEDKVILFPYTDGIGIQLVSTPEPIELCMASYQGLYAKFISMMSPKCSIVENDGELMLMPLHTLSATATIFSGVRAVFGFSGFGLSILSLFSQDNEHTELMCCESLTKIESLKQPYQFGN